MEKRVIQRIAVGFFLRCVLMNPFRNGEIVILAIAGLDVCLFAGNGLALLLGLFTCNQFVTPVVK